MDGIDDSESPPPPSAAPNANSGGIMVFYPCTPKNLTEDPVTNRLIMRAISRAGANIARDSPTTPSGFALMVPNDAFDDAAEEEDVALSTRQLVDKASGDGYWVTSESKQTQWSPRAGLTDSDEPLSSYFRNYIDGTTEMSPDRRFDDAAASSPSRVLTEDRATSTTPPQLCHKFTSCSPTPSTTSTYPDSGVGDTKSVSCQVCS